jgi:hypothetical protein
MATLEGAKCRSAEGHLQCTCVAWARGLASVNPRTSALDGLRWQTSRSNFVSWLEFISSMTGALAWPIIVAIVLLSFRKAITKLLPDLRRLKAGPTGVEMEWERQLEEVREELEASRSIERLSPEDAKARMEEEAAAPVLAERQSVSRSFLTEIEELAKVSPSAAVLEAYRRLEAVLRRAVRERHPDLSERDLSPTSRLIKIARDDGLILPEEDSALQDLRNMRNRLAHGVETRAIDYEQAMEYAQLVTQLITRIEVYSGRTRDDWQGPGAPP